MGSSIVSIWCFESGGGCRCCRSGRFARRVEVQMHISHHIFECRIERLGGITGLIYDATINHGICDLIIVDTGFGIGRIDDGTNTSKYMCITTHEGGGEVYN